MTLWLHGPQHARPPCPAPSPRACPSSCPWSRWCYPTISYSATLSSFSLQSFPSSGSLPMSRLFATGGQSIGASASVSVLPMSIQGWFPWLMDLISLLSKGLSRVFSSTTVQTLSILWRSAFFMVQLLHPYMTTEKTIALTRRIFVSKVISLLFTTLSRFIIAFLPKSKHRLISWLQSPSAVTGSPRRENLSVLPLFPLLFAMKWWDQMPWS